MEYSPACTPPPEPLARKPPCREAEGHSEAFRRAIPKARQPASWLPTLRTDCCLGSQRCALTSPGRRHPPQTGYKRKTNDLDSKGTPSPC